VEDYAKVVRRLGSVATVTAFELNVSCPNVKGGMLFGCDPDLAAEVTRAVKAETDLPVIVKLTPNAPDVVAVARACEEAGADALTAINTVLGMRIDTRRRRPILGTGSGGLSGPAIRPIAVHITYQVAQAVDIPIIGAGGITNAQDALEFLMAGASSVQVGTATFADPLAPLKVIDKDRVRVLEERPADEADLGQEMTIRTDRVDDRQVRCVESPARKLMAGSRLRAAQSKAVRCSLQLTTDYRRFTN